MYNCILRKEYKITKNKKHWASVLIGTGLATFVTVLAFALVDYITGWDLIENERTGFELLASMAIPAAIGAWFGITVFKASSN